MSDVALLTQRNAVRWAAARVLSNKSASFDAIAKRLVGAEDRYKSISVKTGVPWHVIAVIHEREASQSWDASIAQGDPWFKVSTHEPKGRGPFRSFEEAAIDALENCAPFAAKWMDWSPGGTLTLLEMYNGLGYANGPYDKALQKHYPPQASPYIWAGTDQYDRGKYVSDGKFNPSVIDAQLGCAGLLMAMAKIDSSILPFVKSNSVPLVPLAASEPVKPSISNPAAGSIGSFLVSLFKRA